MRFYSALVSILCIAPLTHASPYRPDLTDYNLNVNQNAQSPLEYHATRGNTSYTPSPDNWRAIPFYTVLLDKFADGDPTNNQYFGSEYEWDWRETQLRFGGDLKGLASKLDYIQGMGVKGIYLSGTIFLNMIWQADSYSPLDFTVLDPHWGTITDWKSFIDTLHARGMYIMVDFTVGTMSDLLGFEGHLNDSAPFDINEYSAIYKNPSYLPWGFNQYADFAIINERNNSCQLPTFWQENGTIQSVTAHGCLESDFDQYGDMEAFGVHPDWQRQLGKFASVQDRLREWKPSVMSKLQVFACMTITALDIDAIRVDKATQLTLQGITNWSTATRECATKLGKKNFYITGEVVSEDIFGSLYVGRGRTPIQKPPSFLYAANLTESQNAFFLRAQTENALDAVAFQYSLYRSLTRFLGVDTQATYALNVNFVKAWNDMFVDYDSLNPNTGALDPKHLFGTSNFDVFRWPSLQNGTLKSALGLFITNLVMPGVPLWNYGEEQNFYLYDSTASNYLFGRQAMTSNKAWQRHGCYKLGSDQYRNLPLGSALLGCHDDWNSLDHFDPTTDTRRLLTHFLHLRRTYAALQDGFDLVQRGNWTSFVERTNSNGTTTEMGLWSVSRAGIPNVQTLAGQHTDQVWLLYSNLNTSQTWTYDCKGPLWIASPYMSGITVRNLLAPYETYTLADSESSYYINGTAAWYGCLPTVTMDLYGVKALVPVDEWVPPPPILTKFLPGHDARIAATAGDPNATNIDLILEFNANMSCTSVTSSLTFNMASSGVGGQPALDASTVTCAIVNNPDISPISVTPPSIMSWSATLTNVPDGILEIIVDNPTTADGTSSTGSVDHLLLRKGAADNVMVFPESDYDNSAFKYSDGQYTFTHKAYGADMLRYSGNYGKTWTNWTNWENVTVVSSNVVNNTDIFWQGQHIMVQYWSQVAASSSVVVHADLNYETQRRVPQFLARGPFNSWGYDQGTPSQMTLSGDGTWELEIMASWPTYIQLNVFGYDDYYYGDADDDGIMDRLPPNSIAPNFLNLSAPPYPALAWNLVVDDATLAWTLQPRGQASVGATMYALLLTIPCVTGALATAVFMWSFYGIKHNQYGVKASTGARKYFPIFESLSSKSVTDINLKSLPMAEKMFGHKHNPDIIGWPEDKNKRRKVLIATLEYEIIDWKLNVKIGGLGVMSSLMGKAMTDVDLIWVVPKVKDIRYPAGEPAKPIQVIIFGKPYLVDVEIHVLDNITYVILDSPVFRAQTKTNPYPARMDDLRSAIFYSTWNQAIAATIRRFPVIDIYHINDYHGALAPIYLLPKVIPACLSLHNAEFQGLWPLRTKEEMKEVCSVFNISKEHCTKYVQFGNTFNLLHAAASFISAHQKSVGVAGVSDKYGKRSWARYPALWTLEHIDSLPNPDPTDIAVLDENPTAVRDIQIDEVSEAGRPEFKRQAQEWAGIKQDPHADLFVFVGRWSKQKGVDLIADVMPSLLGKHPTIQLIAIGPVIDLYGRFAAEKLSRLVEMYPDRVYLKPEFITLPPYLFSGADFALIPSRDEPFGLVAVEFGRKGALGIGSRLGGLGLMPGWWFPVESTSIEHMLSQLSKAIKLALKSTEKERAVLRSRSAIQRFPVVAWRQRLEDMHRRSVQASRDHAGSNAWREADCGSSNVYPLLETTDWDPVQQSAPLPPDWDEHSVASSPPVSPRTPGFTGHSSPSQPSTPDDEKFLVAPRLNPNCDLSFGSEASDEDYSSRNTRGNLVTAPREGLGDFPERANLTVARDQRHAPDPFLDVPPTRPLGLELRIPSVESISSIVEDKPKSPLNKANTLFSDFDGVITQEFMRKLQTLNAENSKGELSIERYLVKSEEAFFDRLRRDRLFSAASYISLQRVPARSMSEIIDDQSPPISPGSLSSYAFSHGDTDASPLNGEIVVMNRVQIFMARKIGGWPLYTIIIALGQMLAANSYQMTLLTGQNYENNLQLYVLGAVFLISSCVWYTTFRLKPSVYALAAPWLFYGLGFFLMGLSNVSPKLLSGSTIISDIATWSYAIASAAAFVFFGLNFGEEASAATKVWTLRACIVQGSQQVWVAALWYWGSTLNGVSPTHKSPWWIVFILWPLAIMSFGFAHLMLYGLPGKGTYRLTYRLFIDFLPDYYHQTPPEVPNFLRTLLRRKLVLWFLASEILRDYWLSGPYGRNWSFLWSVPIPTYQILLLVTLFFVCIWAVMLFILTHFSKTHTWLLSVFALGLGAPRWCQTLWGTSSLALYIPWAGSAGPYLGLSLWLWLGVLDAIQGVGLGMILIQTLSRFHVCATLAFAQVIGSVCVMLARATAPNRIGPQSVFPEIGTWDFSSGLKGSPMASAPFWIALICQIVIVIGYFWFYRKEQLARP
ncbi:glycoside hydrolase family 13/glycosyltransferase family 5 protein [Hygrophoropsis aurantiaca]|uniref:Glycoside hydrolase family 13/glycosyltransferase family 5 protein n=1 Tax=Hygrophoropsis aurantiaca TaxID=72124 RepID=A0ACB8A7A4_9AGAM|nr:glycoside hydrolase family 13/glycosyltransferase family 5 protein [Hygrophoropsis aurantiaca]